MTSCMTFLRGLALTGVIIAAAGSAEAQTAQSMPFEQVRSCLCQQQKLEAAQGQMTTAMTAYQQRQQELQQVEQQLAELQRTATAGDAQAVAQAQALIDRRNLLRGQFRQVSGPYRDAAASYNTQVESYNAACTTQPMLSTDIAAAKANLTCP